MSAQPKTLRVAVAQPYTKLGDVEGNLEQVLDLTAQAAVNGCELILFPETTLHGYSNPPEVMAKAITRDGPVAKSLLRHARRYNIAIVVGAFERDLATDNVYISQFIALGDGELIVQRKHLGHEKPGVAQAPQSPEVFAVRGVRCCAVICADSGVEDIDGKLVDAGCQLKLHPTAGGPKQSAGFSLKDFEDPDRYKAYIAAMKKVCFPPNELLAERYRYRMALATSNLSTADDGADYFQPGHSMIIDSDGNLVGLIPGTYVKEHFGPRLTWADIHPATPRRPA